MSVLLAERLMFGGCCHCGALQLKENLGALEFLPKMTPEMKARIEAVMQPVSDLKQA